MKNHRVLGKFKSETGSEASSELVGLRAKMYSLNVPNQKRQCKIRAKYIKRSYVKKHVPRATPTIFGCPENPTVHPKSFSNTPMKEPHATSGRNFKDVSRCVLRQAIHTGRWRHNVSVWSLSTSAWLCDRCIVTTLRYKPCIVFRRMRVNVNMENITEEQCRIVHSRRYVELDSCFVIVNV